MGNTLIILLGYVITFILILVIISLLLRIRKIERKLINFSPTEAYAIMENMHEMVLESSRIADSLDAAIKQKEAVLEDLSDLVDEKLKLYERAVKNSEEQDIVSFRKEEIKSPLKKEDEFISSEKLIKESINKQQLSIPQPQAAPVQTPKITSDMDSKGDKKSRIIAMHKEGRQDIEIARELGISVTEVQLALRLLPKV